jgi:voltage-gated potassium channel
MIMFGLLRALATAIVLVALYYLLPLDRVKNVPAVLVAGVLILAAVTVAQLRRVVTSSHPTVRAVIALATTLPLFLLLFASAYFTMANASVASFNTHPLTRTDSLYFTVTVFSTVGFGDIVAIDQTARVVVTVQMLLDLLFLGLVVRSFAGAVQRTRMAASASVAGMPLAHARQPDEELPG